MKDYPCGCECRVYSAPSICGRCTDRHPGSGDKLYDLSRIMSAKVGAIVARVDWSHRHNRLATGRMVLAHSVREPAARDSRLWSRSTSDKALFFLKKKSLCSRFKRV